MDRKSIPGHLKVSHRSWCWFSLIRAVGHAQTLSIPCASSWQQIPHLLESLIPDCCHFRKQPQPLILQGRWQARRLLKKVTFAWAFYLISVCLQPPELKVTDLYSLRGRWIKCVYGHIGECFTLVNVLRKLQVAEEPAGGHCTVTTLTWVIWTLAIPVRAGRFWAFLVLIRACCVFVKSSDLPTFGQTREE